MNIGFLLGWPEISGGTYVIYEHASRLMKADHEVCIITKEYVNPEQYAWHQGAGTLEWLTLKIAKKKQFDIIIATWWESPFLLYHLSADNYIYFVQSIESRFWAAPDAKNHDTQGNDLSKMLCESTYSFNIPVITEAQWIQKYLSDNYNHHPFLVRNGIRKDIYQEKGGVITARNDGKLRVLVEGPVDVFHKNVPRSIELCCQADVDEIWLLTSSDIEAFSGVDRVFSRVPIKDTPDIYRSCDVLVKLSYIEGMFGPPLEMFHCGGTAIVYDITGHDEYIVHDKNSYVAAKDDEQQVVEYLNYLKSNPRELARLKSGARDAAELWPDWNSAASLFENTLQQISEQNAVNRNYLQKHTKRLIAEHKNRLTVNEIKRFQSRECDDKKEAVDENNFIQLYYWAGKNDPCGDDFCWRHYKSGDFTDLSLEIPVTGLPFYLRIDPSVRFGVIEIDSIIITNLRTGAIVMNFESSKQFDALYAAGTIQRLDISDRNLFLSYGDDPQLILPAISSGKTGDKLQVMVRLKESGISHFVNTYNSSIFSSDKSAAAPESIGFIGKLFGKKSLIF